MLHGISNDLLYSAVRLTVRFHNDRDGEEISIDGTGFFIKNSIGEVCLVTNRHILDAEYKDKKYLGYKKLEIKIHLKNTDPVSKKPELDVTFTVDSGETIFAGSRDDDVACIRNLRLSGPIAVGGIVDYFLDYALLATEEVINNQLSICDFVAFPGFPQWYDKAGNRPIFRVGTVASDPRFDYSFFDGVKTTAGRCLAYEAFSYGGSSGSPVFSVQKGLRGGTGIKISGFQPVRLVGINAGHLPGDAYGSHPGLSYLYKSSVIIEIIG